MNFTPLSSPTAPRCWRSTICIHFISSSPAILRACRLSFCMVGREAGLRRITGGFSIRRFTGSSCSISGAPANRFHWAKSGRTRPPCWLPISKRSGRILASDHWHVFGGSWGSTLALAYSQAHPTALPEPDPARHLPDAPVGRSTGSSTRSSTVLPRSLGPFCSNSVPADERSDLLTCLQQAGLFDPDPAVHMPIARAWSRYEGSCSTLLCPIPTLVAGFEEDVTALGLARMEAHYMRHHAFMGDTRSGQPCRIKSGIFRRSSCRAATIWSARSAMRTSCIWPGQRPTISSYRMPGMPRSSPVRGLPCLNATDRFKTMEIIMTDYLDPRSHRCRRQDRHRPRRSERPGAGWREVTDTTRIDRLAPTLAELAAARCESGGHLAFRPTENRLRPCGLSASRLWRIFPGRSGQPVKLCGQLHR